MKLGTAVAIAAVTGAGLILSETAVAHCDALDGPVVRDARAALEKQDPTPVLRWVTSENEGEIRDLFAKTLAVRKRSSEAMSLADRYFFETLVRVHRVGEGEPFTGLKPAGSIDPGLAAADAALEAGSAARLMKQLPEAIEAGIHKRFALALERKKHSADRVAAGRDYVVAYVDYVHFVEGVHRLAEKGAPHEHQARQITMRRSTSERPERSSTLQEPAFVLRHAVRRGDGESRRLQANRMLAPVRVFDRRACCEPTLAHEEMTANQF